MTHTPRPTPSSTEERVVDKTTRREEAVRRRNRGGKKKRWNGTNKGGEKRDLGCVIENEGWVIKNEGWVILRGVGVGTRNLLILHRMYAFQFNYYTIYIGKI